MMLAMSSWVGLLDVGLGVSGGLLAAFGAWFVRSLRHAPQLRAALPQPPTSRVAVIVPAYNEAVNLRDCITAVLASQLPQPEQLQVWIADDGSTDGTGAIATDLAHQDARVRAIAVPPRPQDRVWLGKSWACATVSDHLAALPDADRPDYLLFIDADVRLAPEAIARALTDAATHASDLYSCAPELICGCWAEWLVQPLMMMLIGAAFDFETVNRPQSRRVLAAGPFMLFRRTSYEAIGGHRQIAHILFEDMALAREIVAQDYTLRYGIGAGFVRVRMYQDFAALWEGWTKNFHSASDRNFLVSLAGAVGVALMFAGPWIGGAIALVAVAILAVNGAALGITHPDIPLAWSGAVLLAGLAIAGQFALRHQIRTTTGLPSRYWWLTGVGGLLLTVIILVSIWKTETGWGWTWRGRSLATSLGSTTPGDH